MAGEAFTVWLTGLPRSGKSTIAKLLAEAIQRRGLHVEVLNSARIRREINRSLGFTREEIEANLRRLGYECKLLNKNGVITVVTSVSPYRDVRDAIREEVGSFVEVYCRAPMEVLIGRDSRGLFEKAKRGEIQCVAGINAPYEEPFKPEILLNTDQDSAEVCCAKSLKTLELLGFLDPYEASGYSADEEEMIKKRLRDLGYL